MVCLIDRFSINSVTGEIVVSFDFARPVIVQEKSKTKLHYQKTNDATSAQLYPIYLLQGNGDILLLLTSCTDSRYGLLNSGWNLDLLLFIILLALIVIAPRVQRHSR